MDKNSEEYKIAKLMYRQLIDITRVKDLSYYMYSHLSSIVYREENKEYRNEQSKNYHTANKDTMNEIRKDRYFTKKYGEFKDAAILTNELRGLLCQEKQQVKK